ADASRPFPLLASLSLNLALRVESGGETEHKLAIVQVPSGLTRLVPLGAPGVYVLLEDVIAAHLSWLFPRQKILESGAIRITRDAELALDDEGGRTRLELVEREIRRRRRSDAVRLEIAAGASEALEFELREQLELSEQEVYRVPWPMDLSVL